MDHAPRLTAAATTTRIRTRCLLCPNRPRPPAPARWFDGPRINQYNGRWNASCRRDPIEHSHRHQCCNYTIRSTWDPIHSDKTCFSSRPFPNFHPKAMLALICNPDPTEFRNTTLIIFNYYSFWWNISHQCLFLIRYFVLGTNHPRLRRMDANGG